MMAYDASEAEPPAPAVDMVETLESALSGRTPQRILSAALDAFPGRIALVSSFGAESAVLLHMVSQIDPNTPILFLDTGMQFGQTLDYRRTLAERLGLTDVRDLRPAFRQLAAVDPSGTLWKTDTDACCALRKVVPLAQALEGFDAWITGRKRFQAITRAGLPVVERSQGKVKVNPLANWSKAELEAYAEDFHLPAHPLVQFGYPSIGCWPCTKAVESNQDSRAGRWAGSEKTECGIHTLATDKSNAPGRPFDNIGEGL
jgi:phosphoadenosine phosphosulfate reductase